MNAPMASSDTGFKTAMPMVGGLRLHVSTEMKDIKPAWLALETYSCSTVYQSYVWCEAWMARVGKAQKVSPCIVSGENVFGEVMFIMPLQLATRWGVKFVEALTSPQGAYGCGLFKDTFVGRPGQEWFLEYLPDVIAALPKHDVFRMANLPNTLMGMPNPLLSTRAFRAANQIHIMDLQPNYQLLLESRRSSDSRRSMRKRDTKLQSLGTLVFDLPVLPEDRLFTLEVMLAQQKDRLAEIGVHNVFNAVEQQFILDLARVQTPEGYFLRPYRLMLNGKILAVMLGAFHHNTYWALISSLSAGEERKFSPGDFALRAMIQNLCESGVVKLDFSAGDTAYKFHWSDQQVPLYFIVRANSLIGLAASCLVLIREKAKRFAKRTPILNSILFGIRRLVSGRKAAV
jgi:CelD/BcsL family acetyltransferase involved in cellulose biosynthesis